MKQVALCVVAIAAWPLALVAQEESEKALVERTCTKCHSLATTLRQHNSRERWSQIMDDMVARGLEASDAEIEKSEREPAGAEELGGVLEIPLAVAVLEHREEHGSFKSFDDFKKTPALEGEDFDGKKDRLELSGAK